ncbi:MAG: YibE/F family protein [Defluviitaleaceae bacterium]|nr:YibE/F family protein [Defluviitaleaceae bacterium]
MKQAKSDSSFRNIFKSGLEIGKDILGTMLNTLILAYIGSSLALIILITASTTTLLELLNRELIIVEFLRALVGSFGMFLTCSDLWLAIFAKWQVMFYSVFTLSCAAA